MLRVLWYLYWYCFDYSFFYFCVPLLLIVAALIIVLGIGTLCCCCCCCCGCGGSCFEESFWIKVLFQCSSLFPYCVCCCLDAKDIVVGRVETEIEDSPYTVDELEKVEYHPPACMECCCVDPDSIV